MHEVHTEHGHLQHQLSVVGVGAPVLPDPLMVHVPQVDDVSVRRRMRDMAQTVTRDATATDKADIFAI